LRSEAIEVSVGAFAIVGRVGRLRSVALRCFLEAVEERVWRGRRLLGVVAGVWPRRYEIAAREGGDVVRLGEYCARHALALGLARIPFAAKQNYIGVGPGAIVHCPQQLDVYARIAL
jgi:hypothetical protein